jgi:hypothetical protein
MADANHISDRLLNLPAEELEIIGYFVRGHKHAIASQNLKLEYTETSIRLSVNVSEDRQRPNFKLLGISKQVNQWQRKVLINHDSSYRQLLVETLTEVGFITRKKSSHPEFTEHHYYTVPDGYKLNYTEVIQLWRSWWNHKRYHLNSASAPIDALIYSKANWHPVRDLQPKQGSFILQTARGQLAIEPEEYIVWIDRIEPKLTDPVPSTATHALQIQHPNRSGADSQLPSSVPPVAPLTVPVTEPTAQKIARHQSSQTGVRQLPSPAADQEYVDLESYLNTFNTEDTEDVDRIEGIYNIGALLSGNTTRKDLAPPPPTPNPTLRSPAAATTPQPTQVLPPPIAIPTPPVAVPPPEASTVATPDAPKLPLSLGQQQESLKRKALNVLANYVRQGDRVVQTEVFKNAQGQEINRKIVNIQRGCPRWAIEQIENLKFGVSNSTTLGKQD